MNVVVAAALVAISAAPAAAKKPVGPTSTAVTEAIIDAIAEEMDRAMQRLELPGAPKPFQISYKVTEVEVNDAVASLGHVTNKKNRHFVNIECRVRVKFDGIDNGNFVVAGNDTIDGSAGTSLSLEATPRIARRAAWLVTDTAYKEALIQLRNKLDAARAGSGGGTTSWTAEKAMVSEEPVLVTPLEPLDEVVKRAEKVSAVFRNIPAIRDSRVALTSYLERRWYLTTEGTSVTDTRRASGVVIAASGQAPDGQELSQYFTRYGQTFDDLPSDAELEKEAKRLADTIDALAAAPVIERYSGPVLFEGEGAAGLVRWTLAPHMGSTPLPEGLAPQQAKLFGGQLTDKLGLKVTSPAITIVDDPTTSVSAGKAVIGGYKVDDEGVVAQRIEVVKDGMLKTMLTARTQVGADKGNSNGHARRTAPGGAFHGTATNLIVTAKGGAATAALEKKLVAEAKAAGLKYGLIIRQLDDSAITAATELSRRELIQFAVNANQALPPPSTLAYKIGLDGKLTLVRGVQLAEVPIKAWKDISGVGNKPIVVNFLASTEDYLSHKVDGVDEGFVPSSGIESSVTTPDLLFKELDLVPSTFGLRARPLVPPPSAK
ncbi:MAG TPA: metallopeptidase TldD-related protein [Kofleriaceae bacterium]|nr:metallopeptidase TldD-related protein [Kofleriaceae bacterium]